MMGDGSASAGSTAWRCKIAVHIILRRHRAASRAKQLTYILAHTAGAIHVCNTDGIQTKKY